MEALDELALMVGLEERCLETELAGVLLDLELELADRDRSVVLGRPVTEPVEVDPVQDLYPVVGDYVQRSSSTASRTLAASTRQPTLTSPGRSMRTNPTPPAVAFLSRSIASRTSSVATAGSRDVGSPSRPRIS